MQEPAYPVCTFPQGERRLSHSEGEAEKFYRGLTQKGVSIRVEIVCDLRSGQMFCPYCIVVPLRETRAEMTRPQSFLFGHKGFPRC